MSMLSIKCDELREAADTIGAHGVCSGDLAALQIMLREAADTIWELRCKLADLIDVDLVRCRDCEHYTEDEMEYYHFCGEWCERVEPDGFCSNGKRKGDE